jgi:hypothetical protein
MIFRPGVQTQINQLGTLEFYLLEAKYKIRLTFVQHDGIMIYRSSNDSLIINDLQP